MAGWGSAADGRRRLARSGEPRRWRLRARTGGAWGAPKGAAHGHLRKEKRRAAFAPPHNLITEPERERIAGWVADCPPPGGVRGDLTRDVGQILALGGHS